MRKMAFGIVLGVSTLFIWGAADAQRAPDLVGTWKGTALAVGVGANPYRVQENPGRISQRKLSTYSLT